LSDPWNRPTKPDNVVNLGIVMREVIELKERVSVLEHFLDIQAKLNKSIRPPAIQTAGVSGIVSAIVTGIVWALTQFLR